MSKFLFSISIIALLLSCSSSVELTDPRDFTYENRFGETIPYDEYLSLKEKYITYERKINKKTVLLYHYGQTGKIENREFLLSYLDNASRSYIDRTVPIYIGYYPGKDPCNSSGIKSPPRTEDVLFNLLNQNEKVIVMRIYKDAEGLDRSHNIFQRYKDPDQIIEKTFFKEHYPCGSNVIIAPDGRFISQFGEHSFESIAKNFNKLLYPDAEN